jgi:hypothetical protein
MAGLSPWVKKKSISPKTCVIIRGGIGDEYNSQNCKNNAQKFHKNVIFED